MRLSSISGLSLRLSSVLSISLSMCLSMRCSVAQDVRAEGSVQIAAEGIRSSQTPNKPQLAVLPLRNRLKMSLDEQRYLSQIIMDSVTERLAGRYTLMSQDLVVKAIPKDTMLDECARTCQLVTGQKLSARYLIVSNIFRFGASIRLTLRVLDTQNHDAVIKHVVKGKDVEEIESSAARGVTSLITALERAQTVDSTQE